MTIGRRACVLALVSLLGAAPLQATEDWEHDWTVVTMARDGSWGVATGRSTTVAITAAVRACNAMSARASGAPNDCGAEFVSVRNAWAVALRCGTEHILATGDDREEAEAAARFSATDLRLYYVPDLPRCRRVLTVDPSGVVAVATLAKAR